jgi:hypothetical protein
MATFSCCRNGDIFVLPLRRQGCLFASQRRGRQGRACTLRAIGYGKRVIATVHPLRANREPSIAALMQLTAPGLNAVNHVILDRMQSPVALIPELAGHLIAGGGKRLRPMLTLGCSALLGYEGSRHHRLAAAVEFIHTATLLHDDVVDASGLRRGKVTANALYGNPASVLVGDFLFSRAFELMVEDGSLRVCRDRGRRGGAVDRAARCHHYRRSLSGNHQCQDSGAVFRRLPDRCRCGGTR